LIATITVLVTGLTLAATFDDAEADGKEGVQELKCKSIGSWFNPEFTGSIVISSSAGKCSAELGKVTSAALTEVMGPNEKGCLTLSTLAEPEGIIEFSVGKKGFITFTTTGEQCFFDVNGAPTAPNSFCQEGGAHTSTVHGEYIILDGLVKDTPVIGGSGFFVSLADHCATGTAPYGNSFTTELEGTIVFSDDEEEDEDEEDEEDDD